MEIPGRTEDIDKAFNSVDVDRSGVIDWNEFAFSIMGETAKDCNKFFQKTRKACIWVGPLANLEALVKLLDTAGDMLSGMSGSLEELQGTAEDRRKRNAQLMSRLKNMKGEMNKSMNNMFGRMMVTQLEFWLEVIILLSH